MSAMTYAEAVARITGPGSPFELVEEPAEDVAVPDLLDQHHLADSQGGKRPHQGLVRRRVIPDVRAQNESWPERLGDPRGRIGVAPFEHSRRASGTKPRRVTLCRVEARNTTVGEEDVRGRVARRDGATCYPAAAAELKHARARWKPLADDVLGFQQQ